MGGKEIKAVNRREWKFADRLRRLAVRMKRGESFRTLGGLHVQLGGHPAGPIRLDEPQKWMNFSGRYKP